jgi:carbonic anhydrase
VDASFADLITANERYQADFRLGGFDGVARAGVAMVTCMDSRIDPLGMVGLAPGDAKIFRNPGGRITPAALTAIVLGVHLLNVERVLVVPHTRCAMTSASEEEMHEKLRQKTGIDCTWLPLGTIPDQERALREDVHKVQSHPLVPDRVRVGGFLYDVDTGRLEQLV